MTTTDVPVVVRLRLPDGREFDCHTQVDAAYVDRHDWWWVEGNGACDCNRSGYLNREYHLNLGEKEDEDDTDDDKCLACGHTIVLVSLTIDGKVLIQQAVKAMTQAEFEALPEIRDFVALFMGPDDGEWVDTEGVRWMTGWLNGVHVKRRRM
jgi:hypothetical protein